MRCKGKAAIRDGDPSFCRQVRSHTCGGNREYLQRLEREEMERLEKLERERLLQERAREKVQREMIEKTEEENAE